MPTNLQPWTEYDARAGYMPDPQHPAHSIWNTAEFPYVVRWSVPISDRLTRWVSHCRQFRTLGEAVAAYERPFRGMSVDIVAYNGGRPGKHLDTLASRRAGKPTRWHSSVPAELRS